MIRQFLLATFGADPRVLTTVLEIALVAMIVGIVWILRRPREAESSFKFREADRLKPAQERSSKTPDLLAHAQMKRPPRPLRLEGIRIDGKPHEVLGVAATASPAEIQRAYRDLMKRYHPDRIGAPGSREWHDSQKIAEAINHAKEVLLKNKG
ncbi:MAG TPA: J domain-containing protein [Bdellovibrionota bacterium]|nr:J domain-containing protein [Bdellovibrionota bacterium]